jgi:hypothetical protein
LLRHRWVLYSVQRFAAWNLLGLHSALAIGHVAEW